MKRTLALLVLAAVAAPAASAAVLVDKPLNLAATNAGYFSTSGGQQIAENFTLSAAAQATLVQFSGGFFATDAATGSFDILFFDDAGGLPATNPFYLFTGPLSGVFQGIDTGVGGEPIYQWTATIPAASFAVPGTYWISIRGTVPGLTFNWESGPPNGDLTVVNRLTDTGSWTGTNPGFSDTDAQAVRIEGEFTAAAVPEPATLALALAALTGLALARRRSPG